MKDVAEKYFVNENLPSKTENVEETKWISSYDGTVPFQKVNEGFEDILRKRSR
jgi:hypothetical protein